MNCILNNTHYRRHCCLILLVFLVQMVILDMQCFRYFLGAEKYFWMRKQLDLEEGADVDFLFLGTSMTMTSVAPVIIDEHCASNGAHGSSVSLNFANSGGGAGVAYAIFRDMLKHRKVKCVVIDEVAVWGFSTYHHPYFSRIMPLKHFASMGKRELSFSDTLIDYRLFMDRWSLQMHDISRKGIMRSYKGLKFGGESFGFEKKMAEYGKHGGLTQYGSVLNKKNVLGERWVKTFLKTYQERSIESEKEYGIDLETARNQSGYILIPQGHADIALYKPANRNEYYLKKLCMLAEQHGTKVIIINIPYVCDKVLNNARNQSMRRWGDYIKYPDPQELGHLKLYYNPKHMSKWGARYYSQWLGSALRDVCAQKERDDHG